MRILAAILLSSALHAADPGKEWSKLTRPGFELFTDASDRTALALVDRLEKIRRILPPTEPSRAVPLRIFLFNNPRDYRAFAPDQASRCRAPTQHRRA